MDTLPGLAMPGGWLLMPPEHPPARPLELATELFQIQTRPPELARLTGTRLRTPGPREPARPWPDTPLERVGALYGAEAEAAARRALQLSWKATQRLDHQRRAQLERFVPDEDDRCPGCQLNDWMGEELIGHATNRQHAVELWTAADPDRLERGQPTARARILRLAWTLQEPGRVTDPTGLTASELTFLLSLGAPWKLLGPVWQEVLAARAEPPRLLRRLLAARLPIPLLRRSLVGLELRQLAPLLSEPRRLRRFFELSKRCHNLNLPPEFTNWLVTACERGGPVLAGVALTLLSQTHAEQTMNQLHALGCAWQDPAMRRPLEEWSRPQAVHPELERLVERGLPRPELVELLHHRRLAGLPHSLPRGLRDLLTQDEREARELAYLRAHPELAVRRLKLESEELRQQRRQGTLRQARKALGQTVARARQASLERLLEEAARRLLRRYAGKATDSWKLPPGWAQATLLLRNPLVQRPLLLSFLEDLAHGRPARERPANRAWLTRARFDVERWMQGFHCQIGPLTFATERNPLEVLRMGSFFNTCLALEGGCNSQSLLPNALDVNKQVVLGRRPDGTVAMRKLLGATAAGELAGYHTYSHGEKVGEALHQALRGYAAACGLRLSDTATPEDLHEAGWYDDGNEAWDPLPEDELQLVREGRWRELDPDSDKLEPALYHACRKSLPKLEYAGENLEAMLTASGRLDWLDALPRWQRETSFEWMVHNLPWRPEVVARLRGTVERPAAPLALLTLPRLRRLLPPEAELEAWTDVVRTVYRHTGDERTLRRMAWDHPAGAEIVRRVIGLSPSWSPRHVAPRPGPAPPDLPLDQVARGELLEATRWVGSKLDLGPLEEALLDGPNPNGLVLWARLARTDLRAGLALVLDRGMSEPARHELASRCWKLGRVELAFEWAKRLPLQDWTGLQGWPGPRAWLAFEQDDPRPQAMVAGALAGEDRLEEAELWCSDQALVRVREACPRPCVG